MAQSDSGVLCNRCQSLDLERYLEHGPPESSQNIIAIISLESIQENCPLCVLINDMLREDVPGRGRTEHDLIQPWNGQTEDTRSGNDTAKVMVHSEADMAANMVYLTIYTTGSPARSRHFLLEKLYSTSASECGEIRSEPSRNELDLAIAREWLQRCRSGHGKAVDDCAPIKARPRVPLRVIDCLDRLVRQIDLDEPYICLSYVWGSAINRTFNGPRLPDDLPKTIEDSISVAADLGIRQLWVDQYCIDQNNDEEKMKAIQDMYLIYAGAELTIIAASGQDASAGLPGVRGTPRNICQKISSGSSSFLISKDITMSFKTSVWNTRGWTYQEGLLSKRRLIFTEARLYYQCSERYFLEAFHPICKDWSAKIDDSVELFHPRCEDWADKIGDSIRLFPSGSIGDPYKQFLMHDRLRNYFTRRLTYGSDSLNASQGILNSCSGTKHFHGIPFSYSEDMPEIALASFLNSLGWRIIHGDAQQRVTPEQMATAEFPSWTWAAYKASYPNAMDRLELDDDDGKLMWYTGLAIRIPSLASELLSHEFPLSRNASSVSLQTFASSQDQGHSVSKYPMWIDITSWTVVGRMKANPDGELVFFDSISAEEFVYMDEADMMRAGDRITLIYLGAKAKKGSRFGYRGLDFRYMHIVFMVVCEVGPETYQRIGLLRVDTTIPCPVQPWEDPEELFKNVFYSSEKLDSEIWKIREVRLV